MAQILAVATTRFKLREKTIATLAGNYGIIATVPQIRKVLSRFASRPEPLAVSRRSGWAATRALRDIVQAKLNPSPDTVTILILTPQGKVFARLELQRGFFDIIDTFRKRRHWSLKRFLEAAVRNELKSRNVKGRCA